MKSEKYQYGNLPIPGGGYVTGFIFSKTEQGVMYIRTDIGGVYRYDPLQQRFESLIDHVTMEDLSETFPISVALDEAVPGSLYIACGVNKPKSGVLAISKDYGRTFTYEKIPVKIHGNLNGRGTDERLFVAGDTMFFASMEEGLLQSDDGGKNWNFVEALEEKYLTFVTVLGRVILVGSAGVTTGAEEPAPMRGHGLYLSTDDGATFEKVQMPQSHTVAGCRLNGLVAQRWSIDDRFLYVTFGSTGRNSYVIENGYSCDSGDSIDGHIARYPLIKDETGTIVALGEMEEITPGSAKPVQGIGQQKIEKGQMLEYGFSGISTSAQNPGVLVATTIVKYDGDSVFLSKDYGENWQQILYGLQEGRITFRAPYMRPECNGKDSLIHWLSDIKINPFNGNEAWFNSGTGVFRTENLLAEEVTFTDRCDGIEETVHLNVYGMPGGEVQVIDIVGDLGGFAFTDIHKPCDNSFADAEGNRYITCINADFSDDNPERIIVTPRGNWTGKTLGGLILTEDQGKTFNRLPMPYGLNDELDAALHFMENPNVNSGWVAMSPDGRNIVWSVADGIELPTRKVIVSDDGGQTFRLSKVFSKECNQRYRGHLKVFSDRIKNRIFYGFGENSRFFISHDGGKNFTEYVLPTDFPKEIEFGLIDCANKTEIRGETGKSGVFYIALGAEGLWKLEYHEGDDEVTVKKLSRDGDTVYRMGLGLGRPGGDYYKEAKAIYFNGIIDGVYGFYRTTDEGASYTRLNDDNQMYGEINSIDGDCRTYGRFYLATGSVGLKYGEPVSN